MHVQGLGLCHGISGNAYSLLSAYHCTKDERYYQRALHIGAFMADNWQELLNVPDRPLSLYEVRCMFAPSSSILVSRLAVCADNRQACQQ